MGLNNATVVVALKCEQGNEEFYVNQIPNPDSSLSYEQSFLDTISTSEKFNCRKDAIERAKELESCLNTSRGILVYDGFCTYTLNGILEKLGTRKLGKRNVYALH